MLTLTRHITITFTLIVLALSMQTALAQPILPKPDSLSGPSENQQNQLKTDGGAKNGGYGVTVVIPFITKLSIGFTGTFSLIGFVYGGFLYVISFTDESQVEKAKKILIWSAVGLGISMLSYAIVSIVLKLKIG